MRDSLDDLESDLGRLPDLRNVDADAASPAQQVRRALRGKHVCPFCGTQRETDLGPCMHCSLEDTPTTRSATRSKLGPWYVLQSRNPSAPGMNFATLMVLVQKGRVTARSVVRGPTTGQFWRHAAKVKGIGREFGMCWNCGGDVTRSARACPSCKRLQEPPLNPDVLLEASEMNGEELAEAMWSDQAPTSSQMSASSQMPMGRASHGAGADRSGSAVDRSSPVDRLMPRGGAVRREVNPSNGAVPGALPPRPARGVLSEAAEQVSPPVSLEMAMFQMPKSYEAINGAGARRPGPFRRASMKVLKVLLIAVLLGTAGVVLLCTFDPNGSGKKLRDFGDRAYSQVMRMINGEPKTVPAFPADPSTNRSAGPGDSEFEGKFDHPRPSPFTEANRDPAAASSGGPSVDKAKARAREFYQAGGRAEDRGDYESAVKNWEAMKALGLKEEDLPIGLDGQIAAAKKRLR